MTFIRLQTALLLVTQLSLIQSSSLANAQATNDTECGPSDAFDWSSITPSGGINWTACYDGKMCARFEVPLDYANPEGKTIALALLKVPANVSTTDPAYRGPILINPGGPGASGVDFARDTGPALQQIVGAAFDILGFDPRAVGRTTPGVDVFRNDFLHRQTWNLRNLDAPLINDTIDALPRVIARQKLFNKLIADTSADVAPYVGTAAVAQDMLSIAQALGQDTLQYWGFSYGSVLGATFASMFPDKVGRMVVDGILDQKPYYNGEQIHNTRDADKVLDAVIAACASIPACPLHESTAEAVKARVFKLVDSLRTELVPVYGGAHKMSYIDRSTVVLQLFLTTRIPYTYAEILFDALADLEKGDGSKIFDLTNLLISNTVTCQNCHPATVPDSGASPDADVSIRCADYGPTTDDLATIRGLYEAAATSTGLQDIGIPLLVYCNGWLLESKSKYKGPAGGNTSFPLLFIQNTLDPVTPLQNAINMTPLFKDAVLITRNALGHSSLSGVSVCTFAAVRAYFRDGTIPAADTVCDDITDPIFGASNPASKRDLGSLSNLERELLDAAEMLSKVRTNRALGATPMV